MKRITSIIISLVFLIQCVGVLGAETKKELPRYDREAEILINMGIIDNYSIEEYDPYSYIPNREFLAMMNSFAGGEDISDYEAYAKQLGALEPNEKLQDFMYPTADFAMAAALGVLGYNKIETGATEQKRAWSLKQAGRLGLLSGIPTEENMSLRRAEAVNLIFNMMEVQIFDLSSVEIGADGYITSNYRKSEDEALYAFHKIYHIEDIVDGTAFVEMYGDSSVGDGMISVGGKMYSVESGADFDKYVGMLCDVYINDETKTVVSVTSSDIVRSLTIAAENIEGYSEDGRVITYTSDDESKVHKVSLEKTAAVISNGTGLKKYGESDIKIPNGIITLYDNNRNGDYDLAVVETAKIILTESVNKSKRQIYNKLTNDETVLSVEIDERDANNKISIIKDGVPVTINEIAENDLLEVYINTNAVRKTIRIIATAMPVVGTVDYISSDLERISINSKEYKISESYKKGIKAKDEITPLPKAGSAYIFYTNSRGVIEAAEVDKYEGMTCAYLFAAREIDNVFETKHSVRVYTSKGEWQTYDINEKIKLNNNSCETKDVFASEIKSREGEVVMVRVNADGMISEIKTAIDNFVIGQESENFTKSQMDESVDTQLIWRNTANYFEGNQSKKLVCFITGATKIITVDGDENPEEEDIGTTTTGSLQNDNGYTGVTAYGVDEFGIADFVVMKTDAKMRKEKMKSGTAMLVTETYETLNSEGEVVTAIVGPYEFLSRYTVVFDADAKEYDASGNELAKRSQIEQGDLIRFNRNASGYVDSYSILCKADYANSGTGYFPTVEEQPRGIHTSTAYMYGPLVAYNAEKGVFMLDVKRTAQEAQLLKSAVTASNVKVFICEGNDRIRTASMGSLRDMTKGDFVYAAASYGSVHTIVIYK